MADTIRLYQHPYYTLMRDRWTLYKDLYEGYHEKLVESQYLWMHGLEKKDDDEQAQALRAAREQRTRYLNLMEIMVSLWTSIFFRNKPTPDDALAAMLKEEIDNIDGQGTSLYSFVKDDVLKSILLYGPTYILADAFPLSVATEAQAREAGARPFLECLSPLEVPDWQIETQDSKRFGKFNVLRREFDVLKPRTRASEQPLIQRVSHELFRQDNKFHTQIYLADLDDKGAIRKDQSGHTVWRPGALQTTDLQEIPVVHADCDSWLKDVAEEVLRHFNLRSNLDNVNYYQGYQKMFAKGVDLNNPQARIALSSYVISGLPVDGDIIFGEPVNTTSLESALSGSVQNIFNVGLNQLRSIAADSKVGQTADAQAREREYTTSQVESELETIENLINRAFVPYAEFKGQSNFKGKLELDKEVESEDLDSWLKIYFAFKDDFAQNYPEVTKESVKKAITKLKLGREEELLDTVENTALEPLEPEREDLIAQIARGG